MPLRGRILVGLSREFPNATFVSIKRVISEQVPLWSHEPTKDCCTQGIATEPVFSTTSDGEGRHRHRSLMVEGITHCSKSESEFWRAMTCLDELMRR